MLPVLPHVAVLPVLWFAFWRVRLGCASAVTQATGVHFAHLTTTFVSRNVDVWRCCWLIHGTPSADRSPGPAAGRSSAADARVPADRDRAPRIPPWGTSRARAHDHVNLYVPYAPKVFAMKKVFVVTCYGWGSTCLKSGNFRITYPGLPAAPGPAAPGTGPGPGTRPSVRPGTSPGMASAGQRAARALTRAASAHLPRHRGSSQQRRGESVLSRACGSPAAKAPGLTTEPAGPPPCQVVMPICLGCQEVIQYGHPTRGGAVR